MIRRQTLRFLTVASGAVILAISAVACSDDAQNAPAGIIGEEPAVKQHLSQADIEAGLYTLEELVAHGRDIFMASFNTLDGAGRPELHGKGGPRKRREMPDNFNRISAPDANACMACHNLPALGGGGDNAVNVFLVADSLPFVNFDGDPIENGPNQTLKTVGDERNTVGMFGSGFIELLAREMTTDLHSIRQEAIRMAGESGQPTTLELNTKGVNFGSITGLADGSVDTSSVEGVNPDLIVRPFHQKGAVVSLREFANNATIQHHGMLSIEQAGEGEDPDVDGYVNELTRGDITALVLFQATLPAPVQVQPETPEEQEAVTYGRRLFDLIGCTQCHKPQMPLRNLWFTEPGPFNPDNDLGPGDVAAPYVVDLSPFISDLQRDTEGNYLIPVFTDLKRHDMGDFLDNDAPLQNGIPTRLWLTRKLWGFFSEPPFLHHGRATLISEAILAHGGEAQMQRDRFEALSDYDQAALTEFLMTLQIDAG